MSIEAIKHYEAALLEAFPRGATGDVFEHWNKARQAIEQAEKQEPVAFNAGVPPLYPERKDGETISVEYLETIPQPQQEPNAWRDHASDYERGFIDGMQKQMQSSVDKAVNAMSKREWVGLTQEDIDIAFDDTQEGGGFNEFARAIEQTLRRKNT